MGWGRNRERKRQLVRPRPRWEYGIKIDLKKIGWGRGLDSTGCVNGLMSASGELRREPSCSIKCGELLD